jgi:transposase
MKGLTKSQKDKIIKMIKEGTSQRDVSRKLGVTRYQIRVVCSSATITHEHNAKPENKADQLEKCRDEIIQWSAEKNMSAFLITRRLKENGYTVSESTVKRFLQKIRKEVYIPIHSSPGEQAQVDFGYLGSFNKDGKPVKVWVFCMILSYSRYAYYTTVTSQSWVHFMQCHQRAFDFFEGVPQSLLIDNLTTAVKEADTFQPLIQTQYSDFLEHYKTSVLTARICRGQDKGKVEAGIKFVKNNFLKNCKHKDFYQLEADLRKWNKTECNLRVHGTTRKIPHEIFIDHEKNKLLLRPKLPFRIVSREERIVNKLGHIFYDYNFYSVPHHYSGEKLTVEDDGKNLRILKGRKHITFHQICEEKGKYITIESHKPYYKQAKSIQFYYEEAQKIGDNAVRLLELMIAEKPLHWKNMIKGVIRLTDAHSKYIVNLGCEKALSDAKHCFRHVRNVVAKKMYRKDKPPPRYPKGVGGFYHELEIYDRLANNVAV